MAGTVGRSARDLIAEIKRDGTGFRFFQAMRLLSLASDVGAANRIDRSDLAEYARHTAPLPALRIRTPASLTFPASEILDVQTEKGDHEENAGDTLHMTIAFLGLTGPSGALPAVYTEMLMERRHAWRDDTAHRFFDMFSHRAATLFYEAWRKHRFYIGYEAGEREGLLQHLLSTVGVGMPSVRARLQGEQECVAEALLAHFSGLLSRKTLSASGLAALVRGCFGIEAEVEQFAGQWIAFPETEQTRLGAQACVLDKSAFLGARVWDRQMKIRLRLGPLDAERFNSFLPGAPAAQQLKHLLQLCLGTSLACDTVLVLDAQALPVVVLDEGAAVGRRLGYDTWLHSAGGAAQRDDAHFAVIV